MKNSILRKLNKDILLDFVQDTDNILNESFNIMINAKDEETSYIGGSLSNNSLENSLVPLNVTRNRWTPLDVNKLTFLTLSPEYITGLLVHDKLKIRIPANYDFLEWSGFLVRAYTLDFDNRKKIYISSFTWNKGDSSLITEDENFFYEDRIWDRYISFDIPNIVALSNQRSSGKTIPNSINDLINPDKGLSLTAPLFLDFYLISGYQTIGSQTSVITNDPFSIQISRNLNSEQISFKIEESTEGDFFEIWPTYNGSMDEFYKFLESSQGIGKRYYTQWNVTLFEENIKGKTTKYIIDETSIQKLEFRPAVKYSTGLCNINVEMQLIDLVDGGTINKVGIYGMKPEQISKYSLFPQRIKVRDINKPKIYVKKKIELAQIDSVTRRNVEDLTIDVDTPDVILLDLIHAFTENNVNIIQEDTLANYFPMGGVKILITPFDNVINFRFAKKSGTDLEFVDLTGANNLKLTFKSERNLYEFSLTPNVNDLKTGFCSFKIPQSSYQDLKNMWLSGNNLFYVTTTNNSVTTLIYSGLFVPSDTIEAKELVDEVKEKTDFEFLDPATLIITEDSEPLTAVVVRRLVVGTASL